MLRVEGLTAGYGAGPVLRHIDLTVATGSVHAVVGHNGAGKTTLLHTIAGLLPATGGRITLDGRDLTGMPAHRRARAGTGLVPQGRRLFGSLTVAEHLAIARRRTGRRSVVGSQWTASQLLELLPALAARIHHRGAQLSGGEQQMLAIARALLIQPRLLLLDEPVEGLAPTVAGTINQLITTLTGRAVTVLLAAPQTDLPLAVADNITVLLAGRIALTIPADAARADPSDLHAALSLTPTTGPIEAGADAGPRSAAWIHTLTQSSGGSRAAGDMTTHPAAGGAHR